MLHATFSVIAAAYFALALAANADDNSKLVLTPFGWWHRDCVHGVESGSEIINESDDHFIVRYPRTDKLTKIDRCAHRFNKAQSESNSVGVNGDGWQVYTKQNAGDSVSGLLGQWTVPTDPYQNGQTLFTFTGLQNIDWVPPQKEPSQQFDIIQPVLQYGRSSAGGGNYWSIASWYVTLGYDVVYSELVRVDSGVTIFGNMTKTGADQWFINAVDTSNGKTSEITVTKSRLASQPWIYVTLEVYSVYSCNQYPPSGTQLPFTQLKLYQNGNEVDAQWEVGTDGQTPPICDASVAVVDSSAVTITF